MVALRSRRLEALFGSDLDTISSDNVPALVDLGAQEAFDLDFKQGLYGRNDTEKRDLAVDVAAMANTAGGIIVLGIDEDDQARAASTPGVEVTDAEAGRMQQIVASLVSPMPTFDVVPILDAAADAGSRGFLLVAVPRSAGAPHAVLVNNSLRYPKRNGSTTRYLSEPRSPPRTATDFRGSSNGASASSRLNERPLSDSNALAESGSSSRSYQILLAASTSPKLRTSVFDRTPWCVSQVS